MVLKSMKKQRQLSERGEGIFGKWAWPAARFDDEVNGAPDEPDTPEEAAALKGLRGHVINNRPMSGEAAVSLEDALASGEYTDVIKEPAEPELYRGMSVPISWLRTALKIEDDTSVKLPRRGEEEGSFTFAPRNGASSSWTDNIKVAKNFANWSLARGSSDEELSDEDEADYYASVIMVAPMSKNPNAFMAGPDGFYKLATVNRFADEDETIGLGEIKVSKIMWAF